MEIHGEWLDNKANGHGIYLHVGGNIMMENGKMINKMEKEKKLG